MKQFLRDNVVLVAAGLIGLAVFASLFHRAFMSGARPQPLGIQEITAQAVEFARLEGWPVTSQRARTIPVEGDDWAVVQQQCAERGEATPARNSLPEPLWETSIITNPGSILSAVTTFKPPDPVLNIAATPDGEVVQYVEVTTQLALAPMVGNQRNRDMPFRELNIDRLFEIPAEARHEMTPDERQTVVTTAREFFDRHAIAAAGDPVSVAAFRGADEQLIGAIAWNRPGPAGTLDVVRVVVSNGRVAAYDRDLRTPGQVLERPQASVTSIVIDSIPGVVIVLSGVLVAVAVIIRRRQGELEIRSAGVLFVVSYLISIVFSVGSFGFLLSLMASMAGFAFSWVYILQYVIAVPLGTTLMSLLVAGCWAAGESQAYLAWPRHLIRPFSALIRGDVRSPLTATPVVAGYLIAFASLGVATAIGLFVPQNSVASVAALTGFYYWPPAVMPALQGLSMALSSTLAAGIFAMTYVRLRSRRLWLAIVVGAIAFVSIRSQLTGFQLFPAGSEFSVVMFVAFSLCLAVTFVKYGPVATFTTIYVYVVSVTAYPMVLTWNAEHIRTGSWSLALGLVPAAVALSGSLWPRGDDASSVPTHVRRALDRLRIGEEFEVARSVQARLLPARSPAIEGLDIAGVCVPANEVGGDYFDYFPLSGGRFGVAIGDVSGKGVGAAIYMTLTKSYMVTQATSALDPAGVLARVNTHLRKNLARGTFVTMAYAVIDPAALTVEYTRAGHNPPLLLKPDGEGDFLSAPGIALGCASTATFKSTTRAETVSVAPGDLVLLYTDGVTEAMDLNSDEYGEARLIALAKRLSISGATAAAVIDTILADVKTFVGRAPQHDDITLVAIRVAGP